jgi:NitT/TauT family transport system ATP-binding protein
MGEVTFLDVSKRFSLRVDGEVHHVQALDRINFTVKDGEIVALIGPSGCGKTTALRVAMGLDAASAGRVTVDGREVHGCGHDRGMVFQHAELLPWLSALQNVMFGLEMKGMRGAPLRETADMYLQLVGLQDSQNRRPHQLSGGMKQRVGIARALAIDPKVLLMDEPFGALDALTREHMNLHLQNLWMTDRPTAVMVTHSISEAVFLSDRVIVLSRRPARFVFELAIELPRPRTLAMRDSSDFVRFQQRLREAIEAPHEAGAALR